MSHEFTGTTQKPRRSCHSRNIQHPRGQKKPGKCGATSKSCWWFSLTPVGWCITSMHHKVKTLTKNTTWKSFVASMMLCGARNRTCGQWECGSCIMTMHQLIPHNWFKLSWPNTTFLWFNRLPALPTGSLPSRHGFLRLLAVPPPENAAERDSIWDTRQHYTDMQNCVNHTRQNMIVHSHTSGQHQYSEIMSATTITVHTTQWTINTHQSRTHQTFHRYSTQLTETQNQR